LGTSSLERTTCQKRNGESKKRKEKEEEEEVIWESVIFKGIICIAFF